MSSSSVLLFASLLAIQVSLTAAAPTANVLNGTYVGVYNAQYNQDYFLGIPYSQPPVGDLRYRAPQSLNTSWSGTKNATEYSPECYGYGRDTWSLGNIVSEDCLTLNVVRPTNVSGSLPVAVWIHGGGYYEGGSRDLRYNTSFIVQQSVYARSPMLAVSINYRLQGLGFLFSAEILEAGAANLGFRDQRLALRWIQENIAAFGGDPEKVTIWGESAGAGSVGAQLVAYNGRDDGLFRGAILESGAPTNHYRYLNNETAAPTYSAILSATGCSNASDSVACLRTVPIDILSSVLNSSATANASWDKQMDGDLFSGSATTQLLNGNFVKVPVLAGTNHDEGTAFGASGMNTTAEFLADILSSGVSNTTAQTLLALYPDIPAIGIPGTFIGRPSGSIGSMAKRSFAYGGDLAMHAARRLQTQAWTTYNVTAYSYLFNVLVAGVPNTLGATHFQEVAFVFHNLNGDGYPLNGSPNPFSGQPETFVNLATLMSRMWISFIVDGDPNNSGVSCVTWPKYGDGQARNLVFDANATSLAYVEPDTFRAEGIQYIMDNLVDQYGR